MYQDKPTIDELYGQIFEEETDSLEHYGTPRHSGRYPWGSGEEPFQRSGDFLSRVAELKEKGCSEKEIADTLGLSTTQLRVQSALAKEERRNLLVEQAKGLRERGYSLDAIAKEMGYKNDSSVRTLLNANTEYRMKEARNTAEFIKQQIEERGILDVGVGAERELNVSREKFEQALELLQRDGYPVYGRSVSQVTNPGKFTILKTICPKGTEKKDIYNQPINSLKDYITQDDGETFHEKFRYPSSLDSKRLEIRYSEDGGTEKDGLVEIRRGVKDLSLGKSTYAQVRIMVDGKKYIKGMAIYADDLPDGVDVRFNSNKSKSQGMDKALKDIKDDPENPFGSLIKKGGQSEYIDSDGKKKLSLINKRAEEGDWSDWSDKLPSQFLSKQSMSLINKQLTLTEADKEAEYDDICALTNPTIKRAMLRTFANGCDASAVHLKAAALPRQKYKVILPMNDLKTTEVYAPDYKNGEEVALIRYPHGGTFEIPILKVNNNNAATKKAMGNAIDAVGINHKVAERLSGADFDGDTVMIIPTNGRNRIRITSTPALTELEGFDPKFEYGGKPAGTFKVMKNTQTEMGKISNLITDMTLKGAPEKEIARAVRHSMVVIDAEKHKLDYKESERDNGIAALKKRWQGNIDENGNYHEGASTLISKAKSETQVLKRKGTPRIDKDTGEVSYKEVIEEYVDKNGKIKTRTQTSTKMAETKDAFTLSSGTAQEDAYAAYANKMKSLANRARKEMLDTGRLKYNPSAKQTYSKEVQSLNAKLNISLKNAPRERQAQILANSKVEAVKQDNPAMSKPELKKVKQLALESTRNIVGAKRNPIKITDREWDAIQAGAISDSTLMKIINNVDIDTLRERATPRTKTALSEAKINRITAMNSSGYTTGEIAEILNVSASTVSKYLKKGEL